jgi:hypothetical protein
MSWSSKLVAAALLLGGFEMAGCNAVLGIEQAETDPSLDTEAPSASSCRVSSSRPKTDCSVGADEGVLGACTKQIGDCLHDQSCRSSMRKYLRCVGDDCLDNDHSCAACSSSSPLAKQLFSCLDQAGADASEAFSVCTAYCACMGERCPTDSQQFGGRCLQTCMGGDGSGGYFGKAPSPWKTHCLWEHCEMVITVDEAPHCPHAIGTNPQCENEPTAPSGVSCSINKNGSTGACNVNADCCSGICDPSGTCQ